MTQTSARRQWCRNPSMTERCDKSWCEFITSNSFSSIYSFFAAYTLPSERDRSSFLWTGEGEQPELGTLKACILSQVSIWAVADYRKTLWTTVDLSPPQRFHGRGSFPWKENVLPENSISAQIKFPEFFNEVERTVHLRLGRVLWAYIPTQTHTGSN